MASGSKTWEFKKHLDRTDLDTGGEEAGCRGSSLLRRGSPGREAVEGDLKLEEGGDGLCSACPLRKGTRTDARPPRAVPERNCEPRGGAFGCPRGASSPRGDAPAAERQYKCWGSPALSDGPQRAGMSSRPRCSCRCLCPGCSPPCPWWF